MSQTPGYPAGLPPVNPYYPPPTPYGLPPRTSGLAIASLILGILGLPMCCVFVMSGLAVLFGFIALPPIRRFEARGRGLAIAGILLGILGMVIGSAFWATTIFSAKPVLMSGTSVKPAQTSALQKAGILQSDEKIEWLYAVSPADPTANGVLLTDRRLVEFTAGKPTHFCDLRDVSTVNQNAASPFRIVDTYELILDNGKKLTFMIMGGGQKEKDDFAAALRKRVNELRGEPSAESKPEEQE